MYWHYIEARIEYVSANLAVTRVQASYLYNLPYLHNYHLNLQ